MCRGSRGQGTKSSITSFPSPTSSCCTASGCRVRHQKGAHGTSTRSRSSSRQSATLRCGSLEKVCFSLRHDSRTNSSRTNNTRLKPTTTRKAAPTMTDDDTRRIPPPTHRRLILKKTEATTSSKTANTTNSAPGTLCNVSESHLHFLCRWRSTSFATRSAQVCPHTFFLHDASTSPNRDWARAHELRVQRADWTSGHRHCHCHCRHWSAR